jgi:glycine cleavage system protein P-like pyridoxal-binding family
VRQKIVAGCNRHYSDYLPSNQVVGGSNPSGRTKIKGVYEAGAALSHVYFPTTAIVSTSWIYVMENGLSGDRRCWQ